MSSNFHKVLTGDVCQSKTGHMLSGMKNIKNNDKQALLQSIFRGLLGHAF